MAYVCRDAVAIVIVVLLVEVALVAAWVQLRAERDRAGATFELRLPRVRVPAGE